MSYEKWTDRIVGHEQVDPEQLTANPVNFRTHPQKQREALDASIRELGFIRSVTVNANTGNIIDGHERVMQALQRKAAGEYDLKVSVEYVDLSEEEERLAIALMDPISEMAVNDPEILDSLLREISTGEPALQELLADLAKEADLDFMREEPEREEPKEREPKLCPECGAEIA